MATFGKIEEFSIGDNWEDYCDRLEQYFTANNITDADKKRAILLPVCGARTYTLKGK